MEFNVLSTKTAVFNKIEDDFSFCFPEDYKSFLSKHNGVNMEDCFVKVKELDEDVMPNNLFSTDDALSRALTLAYCDFQDGGFLLLMPEGENRGLYYYDHAYVFEQSDDDCNTYFLAETFSDFLNCMKTAR